MTITQLQAMSRPLAVRACGNLEKWGEQDFETLGLAIAEETGELCQAILKARPKGGLSERIRQQARDLGALCVQVLAKGPKNYEPARSDEVC